jgi:hypothetical protein
MCIYAPVTNPILLGTQITPVTLSSTIQIPAYVYKLVHKPTGKIYFGCRRGNIRKKWMPKDDLWIHYFSSSKPVKALIAEYGKDSFEYEILFESNDRDEIFWTEQDYIGEYWGNPLLLNKHYDDRGRGHPVFLITPEGNAKACATRTKNNTYKRGAVKANATKLARGSSKIGGIKGAITRRRNGTSGKGLRAAWKKRSQTWEITRPSGEVEVVVNLMKFCRDNALSSSCMHRVANGYSPEYKGWLCKNLSNPIDETILEQRRQERIEKELNKPSYTSAKVWEVTEPDGTVMIVENLTELCRLNNLGLDSMCSVADGKQLHHKGWKCKRLSPPRQNIHGRWEVTDPSGCVTITDKFKQFCEDNDLNCKSMGSVSRGQHSNHLGWTCKYLGEKEPDTLWEVINPAGDVFVVVDMKQFCKDNELSYRGMSDVADGKRVNGVYRGGWKCKRLD